MGPPRSSEPIISHGTAGPKSVVIGTAGHIDHGKTALIRALTGVDTDRLPEEKRRGITVDLGFASLDTQDERGAPLRISFIDVPGHARFVRNMLAGTGGIDAVMLVISAEEGVKPQTEEHLAICGMLGIAHGLVALTKIDAVSEDHLREVRASVQQFLAPTFLRSAPIVPVSAHSGAGMDTLRRELARLASRIPGRTADALARLPIDRAFVMTGFGTVVTGTLVAGSIQIGQELAIEPGSRPVRTRGVQVHGASQPQARAGTRVALNLARVDASELRRGDTLVEPAGVVAVETIDAEISLLPHAVPLKHRAMVHLHAYASECMTAISLYEYQPVEPGPPRLARIKLGRPIVLLPGDRFVLRQGSPAATIGGGRVLDIRPVPRQPKAKTREWLTLFQGSSPEQQLFLRVARREMAGIPVLDLSRETGLRTDTLRRLLAPLVTDERLFWINNELLITRDALAQAMERIEDALGKRGSVGVKRSELRSQTRLGLEVFDAALGQLDRSGKLHVVNEMARTTRAGTADSTSETSTLDLVRAAYERAGLEPPSPQDLSKQLNVQPAEMRELITVLLREKTLVRLGSDALCAHRSALSDLAHRLRPLRGQTIDIAQFKQLTGVSRKYAIPLLEYLDRERVTRKLGFHRIVL
ncbi:MAG TPA: selenocysteine-specific translation elongation factor [Terracidiphilus sp.]|nr:selenocysteine-specific translation elongation factor [Terracidiphilus sp.]